MTITIQIPSLLLGFFGGYILCSLVFGFLYWRDNGPWSTGFSQGYDAGIAFQKEISKDDNSSH